MTEPMYTPEALRTLIDLAEQLGFWDDVAHWESLLAEQEGNGHV